MKKKTTQKSNSNLTLILLGFFLVLMIISYFIINMLLKLKFDCGIYYFFIKKKYFFNKSKYLLLTNILLWDILCNIMLTFLSIVRFYNLEKQLYWN